MRQVVDHPIPWPDTKAWTWCNHKAILPCSNSKSLPVHFNLLKAVPWEELSSKIRVSPPKYKSTTNHTFNTTSWIIWLMLSMRELAKRTANWKIISISSAWTCPRATIGISKFQYLKVWVIVEAHEVVLWWATRAQQIINKWIGDVIKIWCSHHLLPSQHK